MRRAFESARHHCVVITGAAVIILAGCSNPSVSPAPQPPPASPPDAGAAPTPDSTPPPPDPTPKPDTTSTPPPKPAFDALAALERAGYTRLEASDLKQAYAPPEVESSVYVELKEPKEGPRAALTLRSLVFPTEADAISYTRNTPPTDEGPLPARRLRSDRVVMELTVMPRSAKREAAVLEAATKALGLP